MTDFVAGVPKSADLDATLALHGLDRFAARKAIVARLEEQGLVEKIEPHTHMVPHGDRSGVVIEPFLTDQWYVNAKELAEPAIAAVRDGKTKFVPKNWEKTYFDWMENIQPWCISRQLWWGHQNSGVVWAGRQGVRRRRPRPKRQARSRQALRQRQTDARRATRTCSTPGSPRRCGRSRRSAGRTRRRSSQRYLPDRRAGHRLRHHLLLGRAHDDDGSAFHEGGAVPRRLHPRAGARRDRRQDVEVEGQRHRSAGADRRLRRRRAALHARRDGGAGPRHQALDAARRGLPQFRDQAVERRALRRDERLRRASRASIRAARRKRSTAGSRTRPRRPRARSPRRSRPTSSTRRPARSIASSGTSTATGISSWSSRC